MSLLEILEKRFLGNMHRHQNISWTEIKKIILENNITKKTLKKMEDTGGEPDVFVIGSEMFYVDSSNETPKQRRSVCYDKDARVSRKKFPSTSSAIEMAEEIGIKLLTKEMYEKIQEIENFDLKTSSWLYTPENIRKLGGAIFGDRRYDETFIYHNGAESYYSSRGFRGYIKL